MYIINLTKGGKLKTKCQIMNNILILINLYSKLKLFETVSSGNQEPILPVVLNRYLCKQ